MLVNHWWYNIDRNRSRMRWPCNVCIRCVWLATDLSIAIKRKNTLSILSIRGKFEAELPIRCSWWMFFFTLCSMFLQFEFGINITSVIPSCIQQEVHGEIRYRWRSFTCRKRELFKCCITNGGRMLVSCVRGMTSQKKGRRTLSEWTTLAECSLFCSLDLLLQSSRQSMNLCGIRGNLPRILG